MGLANNPLGSRFSIISHRSTKPTQIAWLLSRNSGSSWQLLQCFWLQKETPENQVIWTIPSKKKSKAIPTTDTTDTFNHLEFVQKAKHILQPFISRYLENPITKTVWKPNYAKKTNKNTKMPGHNKLNEKSSNMIEGIW